MSPERTPPLPGPLLAFGLTTASLLLLILVALLLFEAVGQVTAVAIGTVVGLGGMGTLVGRLVPEPADVRIGLRPMAPRWWGILLLLLPVLLWSSEIDNWIAVWVPRPELPEQAARSSLALLEGAIVGILLQPILEEFFFRGVLLQGVASSMRSLAACVFVGALWALYRSIGAGASPYVVSILAVSVVEGTLLGALRLASGSLFAPIALRAGMAAVGYLLVTYEALLPIAGFNAPGAHTPAVWLLASAVPLAIGLALLHRAFQSREPLPPLPIREDDEDDGVIF